MAKAKVVTALALTVVMLVVMTGLAAADCPEQIEILPDGSSGHPGNLTELGSPLVINNDGVTPTNIDIGLWDYLSDSPAGQPHTMKVWIAPISAGASANDINITVTERSGGATASGVGTSTSPVVLNWTQDNAGNSAFDYIDLSLISHGPDGAKYQLNVEDTGYCAGNCTDPNVAKDHDLENLELHNVPEFATIAIPVAAILGLLFFYNHRKRKEE